MESSQVKIILRDPISEDDFRPIAYFQGWLWWDKVPESEEHPYESIYTTLDKKTSLHFVDDSLLDVRYLLIKGSNVEATAAKARSVLPTWEDAEVLRTARGADEPEERQRAILQSAVLAAENKDPVFLEIFRQARSHPDPAVRRAAMTAISYLGWPELREIVAEYASDPDPEVRQDAATLLEAYELQDRGLLE